MVTRQRIMIALGLALSLGFATSCKTITPLDQIRPPQSLRPLQRAILLDFVAPDSDRIVVSAGTPGRLESDSSGNAHVPSFTLYVVDTGEKASFLKRETVLVHLLLHANGAVSFDPRSLRDASSARKLPRDFCLAVENVDDRPITLSVYRAKSRLRRAD